ncbi:MAG: anaerobic ribonucleoside-triphosphate reductase [Bacillota bacterium]|nr:anaerobic ribonucleoside-triphosphate reductase [Bacillota bacterium]
MQEIRKRDGRILLFDAEKITQAIFKAAKAVGGENYSLARDLTKDVINHLHGLKLSGLIPTVEETQDAVEKVLIEKGHARTAKAYILYRAKRTRIRDAKSELMDVVKDILLDANIHEEKENKYSPLEKMHQIALAASQKYYLDNLLPPEIANAHQGGSFQIQSLGYYSKTVDSLQIELLPLLKNGYGSGEKTPPSDLLTGLLRAASIVQKSRNDIYGEQSFPFFDTVIAEMMSGFKSKPRQEELSEGLGEFISYLKELPSLRCSLQVGLDTTEDGRKITKNLLREFLKKKNGNNSIRIIFPLKKEINFSKGDPNYDLYRLALQSAIRTGNPSFFFLDTSYNTSLGADICYFSNGLRIAGNRQGPSGGKKRGNIASLTINLPRLALSALDEELFFVELDRLLRLSVRQLLHRFEVLSLLKCRDLPFLMGEKLYMGSENLSPHDSIKESLKNGIISLGFTGLPEAARFLAAAEQKGEKEHGYLPLALKIVRHMSKRVKSFADEYDMNIELFGAVSSDKLEALVEKDRKDFGQVKGVTDKDFYSSSFILFQEDEGLDNKIVVEGEIHKHCTAGYLSKMLLIPGIDMDGAEDIMQKMAKSHIGHVSISTFYEGG